MLHGLGMTRARVKEVPVMRVIVSEFVTLDGVMEDPGGAEGFEHGGWAFHFERGPEGDKFKLDEVLASDALLLSRIRPEASAPPLTDYVRPAQHEAMGEVFCWRGSTRRGVSSGRRHRDEDYRTLLPRAVEPLESRRGRRDPRRGCSLSRYSGVHARRTGGLQGLRRDGEGRLPGLAQPHRRDHLLWRQGSHQDDVERHPRGQAHGA